MSPALRKLLGLGGFLACGTASYFAARHLWPREMIPLLVFLLILGLTSLYWGFLRK